MRRDFTILGPAPAPERNADSGQRRFPTIRPRDASSLILIDRTARRPRVLVGKRGKGHAFMPDFYVFPGGRRDPADSRIPCAAPLHEAVLERLTMRTPSRFSLQTATGLAVAAARELEEEVALSMTPAEFAGSFRPDLSPLRYIARAVTPPGQSRRFDTRFFACFTDEIGVEASAARASSELHDLTWISIDEPEAVRLPRITQLILGELGALLADDAALRFGGPVPFFSVHRGHFVRELV
jgi:NUDIX domain.